MADWNDNKFDEPDLERGVICTTQLTMAEVRNLPKSRIDRLARDAERYAKAVLGEQFEQRISEDRWTVQGL